VLFPLTFFFSWTHFFLLHIDRDSGKWKVDGVETQRRRELFWELFTYDSWQCWTFGRPPSFALPHFDCKMPHLNDPSDEQSCKWNVFLTRHRMLADLCVCFFFSKTMHGSTGFHRNVCHCFMIRPSVPKCPPILPCFSLTESCGRSQYPLYFRLLVLVVLSHAKGDFLIQSCSHCSVTLSWQFEK
jgi:hypothetical protein